MLSCRINPAPTRPETLTLIVYVAAAPALPPALPLPLAPALTLALPPLLPPPHAARMVTSIAAAIPRTPLRIVWLRFVGSIRKTVHGGKPKKAHVQVMCIGDWRIGVFIPSSMEQCGRTAGASYS